MVSSKDRSLGGDLFLLDTVLLIIVLTFVRILAVKFYP